MKNHVKALAVVTFVAGCTAFGSQFAAAGTGQAPVAAQKEMSREKVMKHGHHRGRERFQKIAKKELYQEGRAQNKPLFDKMMAERRALRQLVHAGADEAAVRAQAGKVAELQADLAVKKSAAAREFLALLTPDQVTKLKAMEASRGKEGFRNHFRGCDQQPKK